LVAGFASHGTMLPQGAGGTNAPGTFVQFGMRSEEGLDRALTGLSFGSSRHHIFRRRART